MEMKRTGAYSGNGESAVSNEFFLVKKKINTITITIRTNENNWHARAHTPRNVRVTKNR